MAAAAIASQPLVAALTHRTAAPPRQISYNASPANSTSPLYLALQQRAAAHEASRAPAKKRKASALYLALKDFLAAQGLTETAATLDAETQYEQWLDVGDVLAVLSQRKEISKLLQDVDLMGNWKRPNASANPRAGHSLLEERERVGEAAARATKASRSCATGVSSESAERNNRSWLQRG